jgi:hypothetical protein
MMTVNAAKKDSDAALVSAGRGIYAAGSIAAIASIILVTAAVGLYFVWPYAPDRLSASGVLELLERAPFEALISLDVLMLVIIPINMIVFIALFAALEKVNRPLAICALIAGAIAFVCLVVCRPIAELAELGGKYAAAAGEAERLPIVAAAEGLLSYFKGTAWIVQTALFAVTGLIFAALMRRSPSFSRADSTVGIIVSSLAFGFWIPKIGILLLFANTIGIIPWYLMVARRLSILAKAGLRDEQRGAGV